MSGALYVKNKTFQTGRETEASSERLSSTGPSTSHFQCVCCNFLGCVNTKEGMLCANFYVNMVALCELLPFK